MLGGFTTFSSFSADVAALWERASYAECALHNAGIPIQLLASSVNIRCSPTLSEHTEELLRELFESYEAAIAGCATSEDSPPMHPRKLLAIRCAIEAVNAAVPWTTRSPALC